MLFFSNRLQQLTIFTLTGIGNAFVMLACLVATQFYFEQRRPLANGIGVAGVGVGMVIIPQLYSVSPCPGGGRCGSP